MKLLSFAVLTLTSVICGANATNVRTVAPNLEFQVFHKANVSIDGKSACKQYWPNYKCCIPFFNNTMNKTLTFGGPGLGLIKVPPYRIGAIYTTNGASCPASLINGVSLQVKDVTNPDKVKSIPGPIPVAKPFVGIECNADKCIIWPKS